MKSRCWELTNDKAQKYVNISKQLLANTKVARFERRIENGWGWKMYRFLKSYVFIPTRLQNLLLNKGSLSKSRCLVLFRANLNPYEYALIALYTTTAANIRYLESPLTVIGQSKILSHTAMPQYTFPMWPSVMWPSANLWTLRDWKSCFVIPTVQNLHHQISTFPEPRIILCTGGCSIMWVIYLLFFPLLNKQSSLSVEVSF